MDRTHQSGTVKASWSRRALARAAAAWPLLALGGSIAPRAEGSTLPWHHGDGAGFRNPPGSPASNGEPADWWAFFYRRLLARDPPVQLPNGHVLEPRATLAGIAAAADAESVTWLGHASFLVRLGGVTILVDPFLGEHASPLPPFGPRRFAPAPCSVDDLPPIDLLLLTHNHYDHLDQATLRRLAERGGTTLVTTLGVRRYLPADGFAAGYELDWYQPVELNGLRITATPAIHFSKRTLFDRNASLWCGFRIERPGRSIFHTGDTAFGPVFAEVGQRLGPVDLGLVPIGAYEPRVLMQGSHCNPEEAVEIGRMVAAGTLCGMHWGTIRLTDEPAFEPPVRFRAAATAAGYAADGAWVLAIGETRRL